MFKPHHGACTHPDCKSPNNALIVVKRGWCQRCNHEQKQAKKKAEGKSTGYKYKRESTGEKDVFHQVLDNIDYEGPTRCFVCGIKIALVTHHNFAHILAKGKYSKFRLKPENIKIMCCNYQGSGCHSRWDFWPKSELRKDERFNKVFELEHRLKEEYKNA